MTPSDPHAETSRIAGQASEQDPTGWFEQLYTSARAGEAVIPWERGGPHPLLGQWTAEHALDGHGRTAVVVGCGLGYDAEHLSSLGFRTTAFDVSPSAVASARERHPESRVDYATADLFALPDDWRGVFDFVFESLTVQSLPIVLHERATKAVCSLVAPGGTLLVVSGSRDDVTAPDGPPWPLTRAEIAAFASGDLHMFQVEQFSEAADAASGRWRVELRRSD